MTMDSGMFQCLASNPAGNIQSSAFLNVFHAGIYQCDHLKKYNIYLNKHEKYILFLNLVLIQLRVCFVATLFFSQ